MLKKRQITLLTLMLFGMAMAVGCARSANDVDPRVVVDKTLRGKVRITAVDQRLTDAGFLEVQVSGINLKSRRVQLQYSAEFFDIDNFKARSEMSRWTDLEVEERGAFAFRAIAPNASNQDYRIKMRKER